MSTNAMNASASKPKTTLLTDDLRRIAEEIRVRIHLAGMDAKDAWARLEPQLRSLEHRAHNATEKIATEVREAGAQLEKQLRRLQDTMHKE